MPQGLAYHIQASEVLQAAWNNPQAVIWYFDSIGPRFNTSDAGTSVARPGRHPLGINLGFADGHVKAVRDPDFTAGYGPLFKRRRLRAIAQRRKLYLQWQVQNMRLKRKN